MNGKRKGLHRLASIKNETSKNSKGHFFKEREIWLCSLGLNLGHEEDGKGGEFLRPIIIFRKFSSDLFWAIPLASQERKGSYFYESHFVNKNGSAMLCQMKLIDQKRLVRKIGKIPRKDFVEIKEMIIHLFPA